MNIVNILIFFATVVMIEFLIEGLRFASYAIIHNAWPKHILLTHKNKYFSWFLNGTESISVITMLFLCYSIPVIVVSVFALIFALNEIGTRALRYYSK